jgi:hypothetical protein
MMELKGNSPVSISFHQHDYNNQDMPFLPLSFLAINLADNTLVSDPSPEAARGSSTVSTSIINYSFLRWSLQVVEGRSIPDSSKEAIT